MDVLSFFLKNLLSIVLTAIITFFLSEPVRLYYSYFFHLTRNIRRLYEHMKHLEGKMKDLPHGGHVAEVWIREMNSIKKDIDTFEHEYWRWKRHGFFSRLILRYRIAVRAGDLLERVDLLDKKNVNTGRLPPLPRVQAHDSNTVIGLDSALKQALTYLELPSTASPPTRLDVTVPGPRVIGIIGVGGGGKTTLLKQINNHLAFTSADNVFDLIVWATVSRDVNLERLQADIAQRMGLPFPSSHSIQERANIIRNYMNKKHFLLLLDDLWHHLDLEVLGIPEPQEGGSGFRRKVVFTTRFEKVCDSMQAMDSQKKRIKVPCLSPDHAQQLFRKVLGEDFFNNSNPELDKLANDIAEAYQSLPLAIIKVIGTAMSSKKSLEDWKDALESLKKTQNIPGTEEVVFTLLKHSYDNLNDDKLRKCFLCCALWPEDFDIDKIELIKCWMGLGLLNGPQIDDRYCAGRANIQILKDTCLLEAGGDEDRQVKMHVMIRDMALQIASDEHKWMVRAGVHLEEASIDVEQLVTVECMSLIGSSSKTFSFFVRVQDFVEGALPKLSTLILHRTNYLVEMIPNSFFPCIPNLTYLDLSFTRLKELPPEICDLTKLQYLNLSHTDIRSLPQKFGQLEKLRYLFLRDTYNLKKVTPEVMPRALEMLDFHRSSLNWEVEGETIFRGLKKLQVLEGIRVQSTSQLQLLSKLSDVQIWSVDMEQVDGLAYIDLKQSFVGGHLSNHLQYLAISGLYDLTKLKVDFEDEGNPGKAWNLKKLEVLHLYGLPRLEKIVWRGVEPIGFLPRLRMLNINFCDKLKNVSWVLQLQCLESLSVFNCKGMTTLIDENETGEAKKELAFPHLKKLNLLYLPKLKGIYCKGLVFPSLEIINVVDCPKLKWLPFCSPITNSKMREIKGEQEWWDGLQWEDKSIRTFLHTHFVQSMKNSLAI